MGDDEGELDDDDVDGCDDDDWYVGIEDDGEPEVDAATKDPAYRPFMEAFETARREWSGEVL